MFRQKDFLSLAGYLQILSQDTTPPLPNFVINTLRYPIKLRSLENYTFSIDVPSPG